MIISYVPTMLFNLIFNFSFTGFGYTTIDLLGVRSIASYDKLFLELVMMGRFFAVDINVIFNR